MKVFKWFLALIIICSLSVLTLKMVRFSSKRAAQEFDQFVLNSIGEEFKSMRYDKIRFGFSWGPFIQLKNVYHNSFGLIQELRLYFPIQSYFSGFRAPIGISLNEAELTCNLSNGPSSLRELLKKIMGTSVQKIILEKSRIKLFLLDESAGIIIRIEQMRFQSETASGYLELNARTDSIFWEKGQQLSAFTRQISLNHKWRTAPNNPASNKLYETVLMVDSSEVPCAIEGNDTLWKMKANLAGQQMQLEFSGDSISLRLEGNYRIWGDYKVDINYLGSSNAPFNLRFIFHHLYDIKKDSLQGELGGILEWVHRNQQDSLSGEIAFKHFGDKTAKKPWQLNGQLTIQNNHLMINNFDQSLGGSSSNWQGTLSNLNQLVRQIINGERSSPPAVLTLNGKAQLWVLDEMLDWFDAHHLNPIQCIHRWPELEMDISLEPLELAYRQLYFSLPIIRVNQNAKKIECMIQPKNEKLDYMIKYDLDFKNSEKISSDLYLVINRADLANLLESLFNQRFGIRGTGRMNITLVCEGNSKTQRYTQKNITGKIELYTGYFADDPLFRQISNKTSTDFFNMFNYRHGNLSFNADLILDNWVVSDMTIVGNSFVLKGKIDIQDNLWIFDGNLRILNEFYKQWETFPGLERDSLYQIFIAPISVEYRRND